MLLYHDEWADHLWDWEIIVDYGFVRVCMCPLVVQ